ncbi:peptide-methionine (S)-S-oxide reductase [Maribacter sp. MAR_2009_72]|uniref:peptide-methionine (S)-S-oxide reductase n=1 Tax=Maribacter sp. MAR_2009_72 TaxID=1250050 RepID=UPI00119AF10C|nr:peptide-methionine (S)-S-oxide reductase [Maribacter sp. MAR_2009_72]TVZ14672.1 peptide-methionine (S)-S-oxide reductase [Maribacter sp. MAR_2009_72]
MDDLDTIGFGGGCHWCTEAVFMALKGVVKVEQGFIAPLKNMGSFSEAVIVHYSPEIIDLKDLVAIHLDTHRSTKNHSMRNKYRSAIYYFEKNDKPVLLKIMSELQQDFNAPIITDILSFGTFNSSEEQFQNYYFSDIDKPFCKTHIAPKINLLKEKYVQHVSTKVI